MTKAINTFYYILRGEPSCGPCGFGDTTCLVTTSKEAFLLYLYKIAIQEADDEDALPMPPSKNEGAKRRAAAMEAAENMSVMAFNFEAEVSDGYVSFGTATSASADPKYAVVKSPNGELPHVLELFAEEQKANDLGAALAGAPSELGDNYDVYECQMLS